SATPLFEGKLSLLSHNSMAWKFTLQDSRTNTAYVGSAVMTDETSVVSSPPPYTAYAAPAPEQAYGYGPYSGAYPPGTQVVYAANGQAYAVPYQYPYAGAAPSPVVPDRTHGAEPSQLPLRGSVSRTAGGALFAGESSGPEGGEGGRYVSILCGGDRDNRTAPSGMLVSHPGLKAVKVADMSASCVVGTGTTAQHLVGCCPARSCDYMSLTTTTGLVGHKPPPEHSPQPTALPTVPSQLARSSSPEFKASPHLPMRWTPSPALVQEAE
ncbi:PREDICTED: uncharacterized protein LOC105533934, partial [Mandrillus leucophaeus]|uniref:uncharacterized protein LOC105533934 n=1 Tax=Mandrillus leucophaeus TaxID=9568 RepID=UPI0005F409C5